jgi:hypothetical protein
MLTRQRTKARFRGCAPKSKRPCTNIHGVSFLLRQPTGIVQPAACRNVKGATGLQEEFMPYPYHHFKWNAYPETKAKEAEWPAKKGDFVVLLLASLAISVVLTLFIAPYLPIAPFH